MDRGKAAAFAFACLCLLALGVIFYFVIKPMLAPADSSVEDKEALDAANRNSFQ